MFNKKKHDSNNCSWRRSHQYENEKSLQICSISNILTEVSTSFSNYFSFLQRVSLGLYSVLLREWFKVFPANQFFVIDLAVWESDCVGVMTRAYQFLALGKFMTWQIYEPSHRPRLLFFLGPSWNPNKSDVKTITVVFDSQIGNSFYLIP